MPIPFRDQDDVDNLGTAAFLRLVSDPDRPGYRGALFQINARGEPVEFTYNRVATPSSYLWRPGEIRRAASRRLTASLLATCSTVPVVLCALAGEVPSELFGHDLRLSIPVCRIAPAGETAEFLAAECHETLGAAIDAADAPDLHLFWLPAPEEHAPARRLIRDLHPRGLLLEPFDRAATGLREVFGESETAS